MTPHPDTERLRYEIDAKTNRRGSISRWPNFKRQRDVFMNEAKYYNSQGKHIATFRLKAWK